MKTFTMRVSDEFWAAVDGWRRAQPDLPGRAKAVRRMVEIAADVERYHTTIGEAVGVALTEARRRVVIGKLSGGPFVVEGACHGRVVPVARKRKARA